MSDQEPMPTTTAGTRFPCKDCGAMLAFAPGSSVLRCSHCGAENPLPDTAGDVVELDFRAQLGELAAAAPTQERSVIKCDACAAEVESPPNVTATDCPYCGFHLNITLKTARVIKPKSLLPFHIAREVAQNSFFKWLGKLWFAPSKLKHYARTESKLSGMYVPYWTYDCNTISAYTGERGDDYWVTVGSGKNRRRVRRTRWTNVSGTVRNRFDDVLVIASRSLPDEHVQKLEPWDLEKLVSYTDEYVAGFRAESYQLDLEQGFDVARSIMDATIRAAINHDIGGDHQRIHSVDTEYRSITFKHILLPVWISAYRYHNKVYRFLVNGRTGEVQGERPWSWIKIALAVLAVLAIAGAIVLVASQQ